MIRLTQELLAINNVIDIGLFGFLAFTLLLSLIVVQTVLSIITLIVFIGWIICGLVFFKKIPRWTRSRPGIRKILKWMIARLTVYLWTLIVFLLMTINTLVNIA